MMLPSPRNPEPSRAPCSSARGGSRRPPRKPAACSTNWRELVDTLGLTVADTVLAHIDRPQASFLIGSGKAEEIVMQAKATECDVIIFDNELTPGQQRKWEELSGLAVIDREEVILDIFNGRARTKRGAAPGGTRADGILPAPAGAGLGASQPPAGRRSAARARARASSKPTAASCASASTTSRPNSAEVRSQRATQRKQRERTPVPHAAIVGYTNAGKSSLLKRLTGADVFVEDKLFATLDPTTRRIDLPGGQPLLLTDTVGFVRKLPHRLIESFKSTLEEAILSDFLVHVLDASQPEIFAFHRTTMDVLAELGAKDKRMLTVFNKIDLLAATTRRAQPAAAAFPRRAVHLDPHGRGPGRTARPHGRPASRAAPSGWTCSCRRPQRPAQQPARHGQVLSTGYAEGGTHVRAVMPHKLVAQYAPFRVDLTPAGEPVPEVTPVAV